MPAFLEKKLESSARSQHPKWTAAHIAHYVFGAMNNMGAMHGSKVTAKGRAMEAAHKLKAKGG